MISSITFPCSSLLLLYIATVPLPMEGMEAGIMEHHAASLRAGAPRLRWQAALGMRDAERNDAQAKAD